jgi:hypothetical protein
MKDENGCLQMVYAKEYRGNFAKKLQASPVREACE